MCPFLLDSHNKPYQRQTIQEFQRKIIMLAELEQFQQCNVELRPYITDGSTLGQTAKLPLGRNFINEEYGSNFCCYVNTDTLEYKPAQYKYFLEIKQLDRSKFNEIVTNINPKSVTNYTIKKLQKRTTFRETSNTQSENVFSFCNGYQITGHGQRHDRTFELALKLKTLYKLTEKETTDALLVWLDTQEGRYGSSKEEAIKDTRFQAKYIYSKGYEYRGKLVETVTLTKSNVAFFADIVKINGKILNKIS